MHNFVYPEKGAVVEGGRGGVAEKKAAHGLLTREQ